MAKAGDRFGATTPGTRKLSPTTRKVWGTTKGKRASSRRILRKRGQMKSRATIPQATRFITILSPNRAFVGIAFPRLGCDIHRHSLAGVASTGSHDRLRRGARHLPSRNRTPLRKCEQDVHF